MVDWLHELGLETYIKTFAREELYLDVITDVDEKILDRMGITSTGHRIKLIKAIKQLKGKSDTTWQLTAC